MCHLHDFRIPSIVKVTVLPKLIYKLNAILICILVDIFFNDKLILKFKENSKDTD